MIKHFVHNCKLLSNISISRSIYYNFKLLPLKRAIKFPLFVYPNTTLKGRRENFSLPDQLSFGIITLGIPLTHFVDGSESTFIRCNGLLQFKCRCSIGSGSKIAISENATLKIGSNFSSTGHLKICCEHSIQIADDCMFSWDITLIDTDYHPIYTNGCISNSPRGIIIGKHVWIGFNCSILKSVRIADNCIISAGSTIRADLSSTNSIYGLPSKLIQTIKSNISWTKDLI